MNRLLYSSNGSVWGVGYYFSYLLLILVINYYEKILKYFGLLVSIEKLSGRLQY